MSLFPALLSFLRAFFAPRPELAAEKLALRQQLALLNPAAIPMKKGRVANSAFDFPRKLKGTKE
jgi:hypothetical protein